MTSQWKHRDFDIELRGERFGVKIGTEFIFRASLNAVKKAIDKHLDERAKAAKLSLPVVILLKRGRHAKEDEGPVISHAVITDVDPTGMCITGSAGEGSECLPDSPANESILRHLFETEKLLESLKSKVNERTVRRSFRSFGRHEMSYSEMVADLQKSYDNAAHPDRKPKLRL